MSTYAITGISRGIGLELTTQLLQQPTTKVSKIVAITRSSPSSALNTLISSNPDRVTSLIIKDVTDEKVVQQAVQELQQRHNISAIDVLINNAGIMPFHPQGIKTMKAKDLREVLDTNVVSVQVLTTAFLPLLEKGEGKKVINMSSMLGSMTKAKIFFPNAPAQGYKVSKTALNMLTVQWALEYASKGFTFLGISPGWLQTDLGSEIADLPVPVGVASVLEIILNATPSQNGKHLDIKVEGWGSDAEGVKEGRTVYEGGEMPWYILPINSLRVFNLS